MSNKNNKMKNGLLRLSAIAVAAGLLAMVFPTIAGIQSQQAFATGNGAPSGAHYTLNLIGKDKEDILPNDNNNGHRIFVNEFGRSDIYLKEGPTFAVLDADATDRRGEFQLPAPENMYDENGNYLGPGKYQVFIRELGKPGGKATMQTCGENLVDTDGDGIGDTVERLCTTEENIVQLERKGGQSKFRDVTKQLTTITGDFDGDGDVETVDIFDDIFEDYLWQYDNNGLKIVQLRFYPL